MDASTIVEGPVKFRDGKKWKCRWCVMRKLSPVADCLHLQLYRDSKERYKQGHTKASLSLQHFLAVETGFTLDKESNTIAIICQDVTVILAFDSRERQMQWQVKIINNLGEGQQFLVQVTSAPPRAKICAGPARLHVQERRFCLTSGVPPRLLGFWDISQLRRYGVVEGRFVFEGGSRCGKGEGVHVCVTDQAADITAAFQQAAQGPLTTRRKAMLRSAPATDSPRRRIRNQLPVETDSPRPSTTHPHSTLRDVPGEQPLCSCSKISEDSKSQSRTSSELNSVERCTEEPLDNVGGHQFATSHKEVMTCRHSYHRQNCKIFQHVAVHSRSDGVTCSQTAVQEHFQNSPFSETQSMLFNRDSNRHIMAGSQLCHCCAAANNCHLTDNEASDCKPFHTATCSSLETIMQHSPFKRLCPVQQQQVCTLTSRHDPSLMSKSFPTGNNTSVLPTFNTAQGTVTCNMCLNHWHCSSQTICSYNSSSQNSASPNFSNRNKLAEISVPASLGVHFPRMTVEEVGYPCGNNTEFNKQDSCTPTTTTDGSSYHHYDTPSTFTEKIGSEMHEGSDESMTGDTVMENTEDNVLKEDCSTPKQVHKLCEPVVVPGTSSFGGNYDTVPRAQTSRMTCKCFMRSWNKTTSVSNPLKLSGQGSVNKNSKAKDAHGNCPCHKVMFWAGNFMTLPYCRRGNGMEDTGTSSRCADLNLHEMVRTTDGTSNTTALYATIDKSKKNNRDSALHQRCCCKDYPCVCQKAISEKKYGGNLVAASTIEMGPTNLEISFDACETPNPTTSEDRYYENMGFADSLEYYENVKDVLKKAGIEQHKASVSDTNIQDNSDQQVNEHIISCTDPTVVRICEKCGHHFQAEHFIVDSSSKTDEAANLTSYKKEKSVSDDYLMMLPGKDLLLHPEDNCQQSSSMENSESNLFPRETYSVQSIPNNTAHGHMYSSSADASHAVVVSTGKHHHTPGKIPTVYFNQAQEPEITVCDTPKTSPRHCVRNDAGTSLSDKTELKTQENLKKQNEKFACDCGRVIYLKQGCSHPNSDGLLDLQLWNTFPQRKQPSHSRQPDCTGSLPKCMNSHFSHKQSFKETCVENEKYQFDSFLPPVHIRRSSSVPCKPVKNRDSSSSNDSGVAVDLILLKARNLSQTENLSALICHPGYETKCLHNSLPRRSKSVDPVKNTPLCFQKSVAPAKCSSVEVTVPAYQKVSVSGSPEGENSVAIPYIDSQSMSSGTSNISDYMDTLSLCSHSSSDVQDGRRLGRQAATTLRPRSGKEYQLIDRYVLEGDIQLTG